MYYSADYRIGCMNVDVNDIVKPTDLVMCLQETANGQMYDRRPSYTELFAENKALIITRLSLEIYDEIHQFDNITVRTWTCGEKGATLYRAYQAMRGDECVALATGDWATVDVKDGHIYRAKDVDLSNYESGEKPELSIPQKFRLPKDLEFQNAGTYTVQLSDCDMNMHMNNTRYHDMLWNRIDDIIDKEVTSINIRYRTEAPCGGEINIYKCKAPAEVYDDPRADEIYVFRTEVEGKANTEAVIGVKNMPGRERLYKSV